MRGQWCHLRLKDRWCTDSDRGVRGSRVGTELLRLPRPFGENWPPQPWQRRVRGQREGPSFLAASHKPERIDAGALLAALRAWAPSILAAVSGAEARAGASMDLDARALSLQRSCWSYRHLRGELSLFEARADRLRYSAEALFNCVRTSRALKGGATRLLDVVKKAVG